MKDKELLDYWLVLYRRRWLILLVMLAAVATTAIYCAFLPDVYESKAVFFIPRQPDVISFLSTGDHSMKRSPLLPEIAEEPHSPYLGFLKSKALRELVQKDFPHKSVGDLKSDVDFNLSSEYMLEIHARDLDPVKAAGIANSYVKNLNGLIADYTRTRTGKQQEMYEQEIVTIQQKLDTARKQYTEFQENSKALALEQEKDQLVAQKMKFVDAINSGKVALQENETKISALQEKLSDEEKLLTTSTLITTPLLEKLRDDLVNLEVKMAASGTEIRESHPDFILMKNQHERIRESMSAETERIFKSRIRHTDVFYEGLRRELVTLFVDQQKIQASQTAYGIVIEGIEKKIRELPELLVESDVLSTEVAKYKHILQTLEMDLQEAKMQKDREPQNVILVEEAVPSETPTFPKLWLNIIVAAIVGMIGGVFYIFFIDYLEETRDQRIIKLVKAIAATERET